MSLSLSLCVCVCRGAACRMAQSSAIVVNLEHIKALIKADSVLLFDSEHPDRHHLSLFIFDLQERLRTGTN
jgi:hypothetical protein